MIRIDKICCWTAILYNNCDFMERERETETEIWRDMERSQKKETKIYYLNEK